MKKVIFKSLFTSILLVLGLSVGVKQTTHEVVEAAEGDTYVLSSSDIASGTDYQRYSNELGTMTLGQKGYVGANKSANYKATLLEEDLYVVKAVNPNITTADKGYVAFYFKGAYSNITEVTWNHTDVKNSSGLKMYLVYSESLTTNFSVIDDNGENYKDGSSAGTYTWSFETVQPASYYGIVFEKSTYFRLTGGTLTLKEGKVTENFSVTFKDATSDDYVSETYTYEGYDAVVEGQTIVEPTQPTKKGYTFLGWYKEDTCDNLFDFATETITANTTLYAGWVSDTATQYTVKFDGNGATNTMNDVILVPEADEAVSYTLPENEFIFEGKVFTGWSVNEESKNPGDEILVNADTTITATWRDYITTSELTFDKNLMRLEVGESTTLSLTNNGDDTPTWNSSNSTVATITNNEVKALSKGTTTITAEVNGVKAECLVVVEIAQGATVYKKITGEQVDYSGRYLVAYVKDNSAIAMKNSENEKQFIDVSTNKLAISNDLIMDYQDAAVFEIIKNSDGTYSLTADGTNYVSYPGSGNSAGFSSYDESDEGIKFNITSENDVFKFESVKISGRYLQYNTSSPRFACYTQSSNQKDLTLFKETVYKASLTSQYDQMLMNNDNLTEGVRLLGSLNKDDFYNVSEVGFVVTLKEEGKEAVSRVHVAESIYDTLIDDDEGYVFVEGNGTFTKEGYASFGLILTDIPETLNGTIEFFAYAKDGSGQYLYLSETITLTYVNGAL